jgi:hypothetical protein
MLAPPDDDNCKTARIDDAAKHQNNIMWLRDGCLDDHNVSVRRYIANKSPA